MRSVVFTLILFIVVTLHRSISQSIEKSSTDEVCENKVSWCEAANPDCSMQFVKKQCTKYCNLCDPSCSDMLFSMMAKYRSCHRLRQTCSTLKNKCDDKLGEALGTSPRANRCKQALGDDSNKNVNTFCTQTCMRCGCGFKPQARVVGGSEASPYSLPWQVGLVRRGSRRPFCGGTLIGPNHVLTAAHCTRGYERWDVMVGEHRITDSSDGTRHTICGYTSHPYYNCPNDLSHDFAIIRLNTPVEIGTRAAPVCLPSLRHAGNFLDDKLLTTSGWGSLCSACSSPNVLHVVDVPGVSNAVCDEAYDYEYVTSDMICAGNTTTGGVDACQGDSGGPLTYNDNGRTVLVGVVSWGYGCAEASYPGVYSRVTEVLGWIRQEMSKPCPSK